MGIEGKGFGKERRLGRWADAQPLCAADGSCSPPIRIGGSQPEAWSLGGEGGRPRRRPVLPIHPFPPGVSRLSGGANLIGACGATTFNSTIHAASLRSLALWGNGLRPFVGGRDVELNRFAVISYNSCRNRHCPKCQSLDKEDWLEARRPLAGAVLPRGVYGTGRPGSCGAS